MSSDICIKHAIPKVLNSRGHKHCIECKREAARLWRRNNTVIRYRTGFGGNRETAIQRDGEKCVVCGMTRDEHKEKYGRDISVDHIDGFGRNKPSAEKNNNLDNLQTLCLSCHGKKDRPRRGNISVKKLSPEDARDIRMFRAAGMRVIDIHRGYQRVHYMTVLNALTQKSWKEEKYG